MTRGIPNQGDFARQAANLGPLSRRAQLGQKEEFSNLFLKENATKKQEVEDAVFRTVGKIVDQPKLGENPHVVDGFKYHRNGFQARQNLGNAKSFDKIDSAWKEQAAKTKETNRKFVTLDNDPIKDDAPAAESLQEKIAKLEQRVSQLENKVISDRFTSNPNVSFPESVAHSKQMRHADSSYQAHGKAYSSMLADLGKTTNHIALG